MLGIIPERNRLRRCPGLLVVVGLAGLCLSGCGLTWDELTSREFQVSDMWAKPPDPLVVLSESEDGDKRAKAFRALQEPALNRGTEHQQDEMLKMLADRACNETRYYPRLEAMRKLGEFKDPRAVPALVEAYYKADTLAATDRAISKTLISTFRCEVLRGLGNNGDPAGADLLVRVLTQGTVEGPEQDKRLVLDERIAAARALKHYPQYGSTEALVQVLKNDKDVALRDCATESLQACTGQKLPADYATWDDFLHHQAHPNGAPPPPKEKSWVELMLTNFGVK